MDESKRYGDILMKKASSNKKNSSAQGNKSLDKEKRKQLLKSIPEKDRAKYEYIFEVFDIIKNFNAEELAMVNGYLYALKAVSKYQDSKQLSSFMKGFRKGMEEGINIRVAELDTIVEEMDDDTENLIKKL